MVFIYFTIETKNTHIRGTLTQPTTTAQQPANNNLNKQIAYVDFDI